MTQNTPPTPAVEDFYTYEIEFFGDDESYVKAATHEKLVKAYEKMASAAVEAPPADDVEAVARALDNAMDAFDFVYMKQHDIDYSDCVKEVAKAAIAALTTQAKREPDVEVVSLVEAARYFKSCSEKVLKGEPCLDYDEALLSLESVLTAFDAGKGGAK